MNDLYAALTAFIAAYAQPAIDAAQIFNGFQVGSIPPEKSNDFAVFSVISQHRVSMTRETWPSGDEDSAEFAHYAEALVQVDFYSKREFQAQERARTFALFAKSSPGVRFYGSAASICFLLTTRAMQPARLTARSTPAAGPSFFTSAS